MFVGPWVLSQSPSRPRKYPSSWVLFLHTDVLASHRLEGDLPCSLFFDREIVLRPHWKALPKVTQRIDKGWNSQRCSTDGKHDIIPKTIPSSAIWGSSRVLPSGQTYIFFPHSQNDDLWGKEKLQVNAHSQGCYYHEFSWLNLGGGR